MTAQHLNFHNSVVPEPLAVEVQTPARGSWLGQAGVGLQRCSPTALGEAVLHLEYRCRGGGSVGDFIIVLLMLVVPETRYFSSFRHFFYINRNNFTTILFFSF